MGVGPRTCLVTAGAQLNGRPDEKKGQRRNGPDVFDVKACAKSRFVKWRRSKVKAKKLSSGWVRKNISGRKKGGTQEYRRFGG